MGEKKPSILSINMYSLLNYCETIFTHELLNANMVYILPAINEVRKQKLLSYIYNQKAQEK